MYFIISLNMDETYLMKRNMYLIFGLLIINVVFISGCSKVPKVEELNLTNLDTVKLSR